MLSELQLVGAHVSENCDEIKDDFTPQEIEKKFDRFGGIFRYVIPSQSDVVSEAARSHVLDKTKTVHVLLPGNDIEKWMKREKILAILF